MLGKEASHQSLKTGSDSVTQGKFIPTPRCQDRVLSLDEYPSGTLRDDGSGRAVELSVVHCEVCSVEGGGPSIRVYSDASQKTYTALPCWNFKTG